MDCLRRLSEASTPVYMALASSAGKHLFDIKTTRAPELRQYFPTDLQVFGDDPDMNGCGKKPHPDIFKLTLRRINNLCAAKGVATLKSEECLVLEDSIAGVEAGRRAGMRVVWIPHGGLLEVCGGKEHDILSGSSERDGLPLCSGDFRKNVTHTPIKPRESPVISDDGRAEMITSLEDFSFGKYGIKLGKA